MRKIKINKKMTNNTFCCELPHFNAHIAGKELEVVAEYENNPFILIRDETGEEWTIMKEDTEEVAS